MVVSGNGVIEWVIEQTDSFVPGKGAVGIGWLDSNEELTAGVMFEEFTGTSIHATIAVKNGALSSREFLRAIFAYPFEQLKVKKIIVQMSEANNKSQSLAEQLGFIFEARIQHAYPDGDRLIYSMPVEFCKWLERKEHEQEG